MTIIRNIINFIEDTVDIAWVLENYGGQIIMALGFVVIILAPILFFLLFPTMPFIVVFMVLGGLTILAVGGIVMVKQG